MGWATGPSPRLSPTAWSWDAGHRLGGVHTEARGCPRAGEGTCGPWRLCLPSPRAPCSSVGGGQPGLAANGWATPQEPAEETPDGPAAPGARGRLQQPRDAPPQGRASRGAAAPVATPLPQEPHFEPTMSRVGVGGRPGHTRPMAPDAGPMGSPWAVPAPAPARRPSALSCGQAAGGPSRPPGTSAPSFPVQEGHTVAPWPPEALVASGGDVCQAHAWGSRRRCLRCVRGPAAVPLATLRALGPHGGCGRVSHWLVTVLHLARPRLPPAGASRQHIPTDPRRGPVPPWAPGAWPVPSDHVVPSACDCADAVAGVKPPPPFGA